MGVGVGDRDSGGKLMKETHGIVRRDRALLLGEEGKKGKRIAGTDYQFTNLYSS